MCTSFKRMHTPRAQILHFWLHPCLPFLAPATILSYGKTSAMRRKLHCSKWESATDGGVKSTEVHCKLSIYKEKAWTPEKEIFIKRWKIEYEPMIKVSSRRNESECLWDFLNIVLFMEGVWFLSSCYISSNQLSSRSWKNWITVCEWQATIQWWANDKQYSRKSFYGFVITIQSSSKMCCWTVCIWLISWSSSEVETNG